MSEFVIETRGLGKEYNGRLAVDGLALRVGTGQITAFLGRNGAGKSTTIKLLLGMCAPSAGVADVLGQRVGTSTAGRAIRRDVAYVSEDKYTYGYLTVGQMISFTRSFYADWRLDLERALVRQYGLQMHMRVDALSRGMRSKLALLLALARRPRLLILDEPTEGLDPVSVECVLQAVVTAASEGTTVFLSSHRIEEVERIADHVCIIDRGHLLVDASADHIKENYRRIALAFQETPPAAGFAAEGIESVRTSGRHVTILASHGADSIIEYGYSLGAISVDSVGVSLRDVFLATVSEGAS